MLRILLKKQILRPDFVAYFRNSASLMYTNSGFQEYFDSLLTTDVNCLPIPRTSINPCLIPRQHSLLHTDRHIIISTCIDMFSGMRKRLMQRLLPNTIGKQRRIPPQRGASETALRRCITISITSWPDLLKTIHFEATRSGRASWP